MGSVNSWKCSTSLVTRETQLESVMRFYYPPIRMAEITTPIPRADEYIGATKTACGNELSIRKTV
jgi:hypothetical protein